MNRRAADNKLLLTDPDVVDRYVDGLARCIEHARLNDFYPPADAILNSLDMMSPELNGQLYPQLELHAATGLPTYREFIRVTTDQSRATEELPHLSPWKDAKGDDIYGVLSRKYRYYQELVAVDRLLLESKKIYFRKIDKASSTAMFRIVLDRITLHGTLERLTVEVRQRHGIWGRTALTVDDMDAAAMSESIQGIVYRMAFLDAEVIFIRLNEDPNLQAESVTKGIIGPYLFPLITPEVVFMPQQAIAGSGAVLNISSTTASVEQATDVFNDPFHLKPQFSKEARKDMERALSRASYHVMTDRKFILNNADRRAFREFIGEFGTDNIIYEAVDE